MDIVILETGDDFIKFIKEIQDKAAERGLTEEILNEILDEAHSENS